MSVTWRATSARPCLVRVRELVKKRVAQQRADGERGECLHHGLARHVVALAAGSFRTSTRIGIGAEVNAQWNRARGRVTLCPYILAGSLRRFNVRRLFGLNTPPAFPFPLKMTGMSVSAVSDAHDTASELPVNRAR